MKRQYSTKNSLIRRAASVGNFETILWQSLQEWQITNLSCKYLVSEALPFEHQTEMSCTTKRVEPEILRYKVFEPILLLGHDRFANVDIRIRVKGGGYTSQIYGVYV